jgi:hypothetical protein
MSRSFSMHQLKYPLAAAAAIAALSVPAHAFDDAAAAPCAATSPDQPKKKKGFGLGGLMSAAKNAGVGRMLGSGMLGRSTGTQIAGAVAGTAIQASGTGGPAVVNPAQVVSGGSQAAQIAGAVAGTAVNTAAAAGAQTATLATNCVVSPTQP